MTYTTADLVPLKEALLTGALTISSNGRTITFKSNQELEKLIAKIELNIAAQEATPEEPFVPVSNRIKATFTK